MINIISLSVLSHPDDIADIAIKGPVFNKVSLLSWECRPQLDLAFGLELGR